MKSDLLDIIKQMPNKRILVIGDMVADVYLNGNISRISREAPVLVLEQTEEIVIPGGAANVVHNIATLGGKALAVGLLGNDSAGKNLKEILATKQVNVDGLLCSGERVTSTKTRIIAGGRATVSQQIVRIDKEEKQPITPDLESCLMNYLADVLPSVDGVVLSDYGSGTLTDSVVKLALFHSDRLGIPVMVDSRYRILDFKGVSYVKQNDAEVAAVVGFSLSDEEKLMDAGTQLLEEMEAKGILVTLGAKGMALFEQSGAVHMIPVSNRSEVYDVSGAGDTCVAAFMLALAAGADPVQAAELSNFASGIAVRKLGTATVSAEELRLVIGEYRYGH